jgi:hypothetical protein
MDIVAIKRRGVRRQIPFRDFHRAFWAALILLIVVAAAIYHRGLLPGFKHAADAPYSVKDLADHPLRTGSLLIVPARGNRCRHGLIDNMTWVIRDNGYVDCDEIMERGIDQATREFSTPRLDAIRAGFRRQKQ